ncbi:MAG: hypothetical protein CL899_04840 [Dehalococcoidia bacterium]|nr:hypothetical protein [Dehalococcoidia bacterium]|tara:strand:- start:272 stop:1267 length:996 start_codon:yes stop_codon:yes gene_type:complete
MNIKILGNTTWGSTLAMLICRAGNDVSLIYRTRDKSEEAQASGVLLVKDFSLEIPKNLKFEHLGDLKFESSDVLIIAVPSDTIEKNIGYIKTMAMDGITVISATKGLSKSGDTLSITLAKELNLDSSQIGTLSGPNLATEIISGNPAITSLSFEDINKANSFRNIFSSPLFRIYSGNDVIGSEIGGSLKNIIAIGCGIIDKLNLGDNAKSAFITRGLREITRFGLRRGAKEYTFYGLSGLGDLFATCVSSHSRNWKLGYSIGSGKSVDQFKKETGYTVEGVEATRIVNMISERDNISMPITNMTNKVINQEYDPETAIKEFMTRDLSRERN